MLVRDGNCVERSVAFGATAGSGSRAAVGEKRAARAPASIVGFVDTLTARYFLVGFALSFSAAAFPPAARVLILTCSLAREWAGAIG